MLDIYTNRNNFSLYKNIESKLIFSQCTDSEIDISICIPTYKRVDTLFEAIDSAIKQQPCDLNYEIIILDNEPDFKNKKIFNIVKQKNFPNLLYYKNTKNIGMFGNINRCFELARGKYVSLLHDDDLLCNDYLKSVKNLLYTRYNCIINNFIFFSDTNPDIRLQKSHMTVKKYIKHFIHMFVKFFLPKKTRLYNWQSYFLHWNIFGPPSCGIIFEKESFLSSGGFDEEFFPSSDWYFMLYYNQHYNVVKLHKELSLYRWEINESQKPETQALSISQFKPCIEFLRRSFKSIILKNLFYNYILDDFYCTYNINEEYVHTHTFIKHIYSFMKKIINKLIYYTK